MMEVLSLCDTNGDDRLSLVEARICEVCLDTEQILKDAKVVLGVEFFQNLPILTACNSDNTYLVSQLDFDLKIFHITGYLALFKVALH